ncbi:CPBP family intramembrane glutamic endopeptidase [Chryseolinea sp. T2]|uniref:CPBP family intramembrane glutamic endopeptidase n=1 Tax=Chryseolinea sp. T2 TaxID=3129255 RepID=UPI003077C4E0
MLRPGTLISDRTPIWSLLRITFTLLAGYIAAAFLVAAIISLVYEKDISTINEVIDPEMAMPLLIAQGLMSFVAFIFFPLIHITALEHKPLWPLIENRKDLGKTLSLVLILGLAFPLAISPLAEWNAHMKFPEFMAGFERWAREQEELLGKATDAVTSFDTIGGLLIALFIMAVIAGIGEELVFRGLIQNELWRGSNNIHLAIWASAFVFSAIHMQFFGFVPRLLLGALFGYLYYWSGNLLVPMFAHFVNNAFGVILRYLYNIKAISTDVAEDDAAPWSLVIVSAVIAAVMIYQLHKKRSNERAETVHEPY